MICKKIVNLVTITCLAIVIQSASVSAAEMTAASDQKERGSWYIYGDIGLAKGDASIAKLNNELVVNNIQGIVTSIDDDRFGWDVGLGYNINDYFALEFGYLDLGEVELRASANTTQLLEFFDAIEEVHPESGDGLTLAAVGNLPLSENWSLNAKIGYFDWDGDFDTFNLKKEVGDDQDEGGDIFYGVGIKYKINRKWDISAQWRRYTFNFEDSDFFSVGFQWYPFAKKHL